MLCESQYTEDLNAFVKDYLDKYRNQEQFNVLQGTTSPIAERRSLCPDLKHVLYLSIHYNSAYQCPQLYFNVYHEDGSLLMMDELKDVFNHKNFAQTDPDVWSWISQSEHPVHGIAFYNVHPCNTTRFMNELSGSGTTITNYITSWLSIYASFLDVDVSLLCKPSTQE